jgi:hypothetical protein
MAKTKTKKPKGKQGRGESKTSPRMIKAREKEGRALELRLYGANYEGIAEQLGYADASGAYKAISRALDRLTAEPSKEVLRIELERLDRMLSAVLGQAVQGHLGSIDRVLKIMERRAKLLGLDAVTLVEQAHTGEVSFVFRVEYGDPDETIKGSFTEPPLLPTSDQKQ